MKTPGLTPRSVSLTSARHAGMAEGHTDKLTLQKHELSPVFVLLRNSAPSAGLISWQVAITPIIKATEIVFLIDSSFAEP